MARELAFDEFAHIHHHERSHPSHTLATAEVIFLARSGESVQRQTLTHCYQITNHPRDIYADDVWIDLVPAAKLVDFFEASLATAVADRPAVPAAWTRETGTNDPEITVVNAAFALALLERHGLTGEGPSDLRPGPRRSGRCAPPQSRLVPPAISGTRQRTDRE